MAPSENTRLRCLTSTDESKHALPRQSHSASSHASKSMGVDYYESTEKTGIVESKDNYETEESFISLFSLGHVLGK